MIRMHTGAPPFNRYDNRRGDSSGGPTPRRAAWAMAPGIEDFNVRAPGDLNDDGIQRERMPWMHSSAFIVPGGGWFDWTNNAERRPSLHMLNRTLSRQIGTSNTRNQDPVAAGLGIQDGNGSLPAGIKQINQLGIVVPTNGTPHGMHTMQRRQPRTTTQRHMLTPQQRPPRINRLSNSRNMGQSYSQTTIHQGG